MIKIKNIEEKNKIRKVKDEKDNKDKKIKDKLCDNVGNQSVLSYQTRMYDFMIFFYQFK